MSLLHISIPHLSEITQAMQCDIFVSSGLLVVLCFEQDNSSLLYSQLHSLPFRDELVHRRGMRVLLFYVVLRQRF